jgi:hypothetical protein
MSGHLYRKCVTQGWEQREAKKAKRAKEAKLSAFLPLLPFLPFLLPARLTTVRLCFEMCPDSKLRAVETSHNSRR